MSAEADKELQQRPVSFWRRMREYCDWKANPVLVKDLRLWMRGHLFIVMYFLMILLVVAGSALYTFQAREKNFNGQNLWVVLFGVVLAICGAIIPNMIYERFRSELKNRATELAMLSDLTAARIVRGKLMSAWLGSMLVFAATAPALSTAYLLGGIDFRTALYFVLWMLWVALVMPTIQLMLATLGMHVGFRLFSILAFLAQFLGAIIMAVAFAVGFLDRNTLDQSQTWLVSGLIYFGGLALGYFFYHVAVSRLRGENENREMLPRLVLSVIALIGAVVFDLVLNATSTPSARDLLMAPALVIAYVVGFGFLFITSTTDHLPLHMTLNWPSLGAWRLLFYPGNRRLCAYLLANFGLVFALLAVSALVENTRINREWYTICSAALLPFVLLAVGMVAHDIVVVPFCHHRKLKLPGIVSIVGANILLGLIAATGAVMMFVSPGTNDMGEHLLSISPVGFFVNLFRFSNSAYIQDAGLVLIAETLFLAIFLAVISLSAWREGLHYHVGGSGKYVIYGNGEDGEEDSEEE